MSLTVKKRGEGALHQLDRNLPMLVKCVAKKGDPSNARDPGLMMARSGQRRGGDRTCGRLKRLLLEEWRVLISRCCACRAQRNSMAWGQAFGPVALVVFPVGHVKEQASRHLTKPMLSRGSPVQATSLRQ